MKFTAKILLLVVLFATLVIGSGVANASSGCIHVVRSGENLFRISLNYGVSMWDVAELNGIIDLRRIYVGQTLKMPLASCSHNYPPIEHYDPYEPYDPYDPGITDGYYIVQAGDTLNRIALRFGVTLESLIYANHLNYNTTIYVGQKLIIPVDGVMPGDGSGNGTGSGDAPLACGPGVHQVACWPEYGGVWAQDSIRTEPIITRWETCKPEEINEGDLLACSKTGLGWFPWTPPPVEEVIVP